MILFDLKKIFYLIRFLYANNIICHVFRRMPIKTRYLSVSQWSKRSINIATKKSPKALLKMARVARLSCSFALNGNFVFCLSNFITWQKHFSLRSLALELEQVIRPVESSHLFPNVQNKKPNNKSYSVFYTRVARFELATFWFVAKRSIQLGYTRILHLIKLFIIITCEEILTC